MNLLKKEVVHKTLGVGHVVSFDGKIITVQFGERSVKFSFPSIFNDILSMKDPALQNEVKELCDHENNQINQQQEERMTEFEQRFAASIDAKANKAKNTKKYKDNNNVAIKCNYCDGGRSDQAFGYKSLCSDEVLHQNVSVIKRPWCSSAECECKKYTLGEIDRTELERMNRNGKFICYESRLLKDWIASVGRVQREKRTDKPKKTWLGCKLVLTYLLWQRAQGALRVAFWLMQTTTYWPQVLMEFLQIQRTAQMYHVLV